MIQSVEVHPTFSVAFELTCQIVRFQSPATHHHLAPTWGNFPSHPGDPMELPPEIPVPVELTQLAAASVQDEWCQLLILREQVGAEVTIDVAKDKSD